MIVTSIIANYGKPICGCDGKRKRREEKRERDRAPAALEYRRYRVAAMGLLDALRGRGRRTQEESDSNSGKTQKLDDELSGANHDTGSR